MPTLPPGSLPPGYPGTQRGPVYDGYPVDDPTYATITHVTDDGRIETFRLEFLLGDTAFRTWRTFKAYWMKQPRSEDFASGREAEIANTHLFYVDNKGKTEELRVIISDGDFALWIGQVDNQQLPEWAYRGSGRRPSRAQKLTTWQEKKGGRQNLSTGYRER